MKTFLLIISTPDGEMFNGEAVNISLRGVEGDLAVMAGANLVRVGSKIFGERKY